jgi:hypothetical protein
MTDEKIKEKISKIDNLDLEEDILRLVCGISTFTDKTHEEIEKEFGIIYACNSLPYLYRKQRQILFYLYKEVERIKGNN